MSLHLIVGCMYASKTTSLIQKYNESKDKKINIMVIDYDTGNQDKYYESTLKNHIRDEIPCIKCNKLNDIMNIYKKRGNFQISHEFEHHSDFITSSEMYETVNNLLNSKIILINEAQFFPDLIPFVKNMLKKGKEIYVYGLDGDFKQERIGFILDLVPLCDSIIKLKAECICGNPAIFSKRISAEIEQYQPNAAYIPICRKCNG